MGYLHIDNLYKQQNILLFKRCYALEKIHGSSAHVSWNFADKSIKFFSGGESHSNFVKLFDEENLRKVFEELFLDTDAVVYGEVYGGKCQGMSETYGKEMKFIAFDVKVNELWLNVPNAQSVVLKLGLEFVDYVEISTNLDEIDHERDKDSVQAIRNGMGVGKKREGVVLRPLVELRTNNGERIISKHKGDSFKETKSPRTVDEGNLVVLTKANEIAEEWVTAHRLEAHILPKMGEVKIENTNLVINAMIEDVYREAKGEIVESKEVAKAIGQKTAKMFRKYLAENV